MRNCSNALPPKTANEGILIADKQLPNFLTLMWQSYIFGMHWKHDGKLYYDELPAESEAEAAGYFIDHKRDDVSLVRVELIGPNEGGVREFAHSPDSPFSPLIARRRLDVDDDAR